MPLRAGASRADITPPLDVGILMGQGRWAPFEGVRLPLQARTLLLECGAQRVALVSLEILGISGLAFGGREAFKASICDASDGTVRPGDLILTATHTHSGPETMGLTDLYQTAAFKNWAKSLAERIGESVRQAASRLSRARLVLGSASAPGLAIHRRIRTTEGVVLSHPPPAPEKVISREGPVDDSVLVEGLLDDDGRPISLLVNAVCHPVHEMCIKFISPDYPGEMSLALERSHPPAVALFLSGCAGNINPVLVSDGAEGSGSHGRELAKVVERALGAARPVEVHEVQLKRRSLALPARTGAGRPGAPLRTEICAVRMGEAGLVFVPGEPFVEIGLTIRKASPCAFTAVVACAEDSIGYIPTDRAFDEGGYELGPGRWARVARGSEEIVRREALACLTAP